MQCWIYRGSEREGLYVWVSTEDGLDDVPVPVRRQLGRPALAMTLELHAHSKLGQEDPAKVLANLERQGFHVQMPRDIESEAARAAQRDGAGRTGSSEPGKG